MRSALGQRVAVPRPVLILFAHPAFQKSRVHRRLVDAVRDLPDVTFHAPQPACTARYSTVPSGSRRTRSPSPLRTEAQWHALPPRWHSARGSAPPTTPRPTATAPTRHLRYVPNAKKSWPDGPTQAAIHRACISYLQASVNEIDRRLASMRITANVDGTVASPRHDRLPGRFLQQGEELFQIHSDHRSVRVVLTEEEVARAQLEIGSEAELRWTCDPSRTVRAVVCEIHASASRYELPPELTMAAGGDVYVRPTAGSLLAADRPYLHVMLQVEAVPLPQRGSGLTARVWLPARVQLLGGWVQHRMLSFLNAWRMS